MNEQELNYSNYKIITEINDDYRKVVETGNPSGNNPNKIKHAEYFIVFYDGKDLPVGIATYLNKGLYKPGVYRISDVYVKPDKLYRLPSQTALKRRIKIAVNDIFETEIKSRLVFITRKNNQGLFDSMLKRYGYVTDLKNYYLVTEPKYQQSSWRRITYRGDLSLLDIPVITNAQYDGYFG